MRSIFFAVFAVASLPIASPVSAQPPELPPLPSIDGESSESRLVRSLAQGLGDADPEVRLHLGIALSKLGSIAVPTLIEALRDRNPDRRAGAAYALAQMRSDGRYAIPNLTEALRDPEPRVRRQAAYALSRLVERNSANLPPLPIPTGENPLR